MDTDATVLIAKNPRYKNLIQDSNKRESWNPAYNKRGSKNPNAVRKTLNRESNNPSYNKRGSKNPRSARKTQNPESDDNLFAGSELPPSTWGVTGPRASEPLPLIEVDDARETYRTAQTVRRRSQLARRREVENGTSLTTDLQLLRLRYYFKQFVHEHKQPSRIIY
eukprot:713884_1